MTAIHYENAPLRMQELWEWVVAMDAFDHGDRAPLSLLIRSQPIPPEMVEPIAAIIEGQRVPKRGSKRLKIPAAERMQIAATISVIQHLCDMFRLESNHIGLRFVEQAAARRRTEVKDVVDHLHATYRKPVEQAAQQLGVSTETIEILLRDMRELIGRWPTV